MSRGGPRSEQRKERGGNEPEEGLSTTASWGPVPIRIALGVIFFARGAQKLFGWFGGHGLEGAGGVFAEKLGMHPGVFWAVLACLAEFGGALLVLAGFGTRPGASALAGVMLVAMFQVHWGAFFLP